MCFLAIFEALSNQTLISVLLGCHQDNCGEADLWRCTAGIGAQFKVRLRVCPICSAKQVLGKCWVVSHS